MWANLVVRFLPTFHCGWFPGYQMKFHTFECSMSFFNKLNILVLNAGNHTWVLTLRVILLYSSLASLALIFSRRATSSGFYSRMETSKFNWRYLQISKGLLPNNGGMQTLGFMVRSFMVCWSAQPVLTGETLLLYTFYHSKLWILIFSLTLGGFTNSGRCNELSSRNSCRKKGWPRITNHELDIIL